MPDPSAKPNPFEGDTNPPKPIPLPPDAPPGAVSRMPGNPGIWIDAKGMEVKAKAPATPTPAPSQPSPATPAPPVPSAPKA